MDRGFAVFLPQDIRTESGERPPADMIFRECASGVLESDVIVGLVDGPDVDSGTAWELGYAYANRKPKRLSDRNIHSIGVYPAGFSPLAP